MVIIKTHTHVTQPLVNYLHEAAASVGTKVNDRRGWEVISTTYMWGSITASFRIPECAASQQNSIQGCSKCVTR